MDEENKELIVKEELVTEIHDDCTEDTGSGYDTEDDAVEFLLHSIKHNPSTNQKKQQECPEERKFICTVCKKKFLKKANLLDHLKIHANLKNFKCTECGRAFIQRVNMLTHLRTHTKLKPFICQMPNCGKRYSQASQLKTHIRGHLNEKTHICKFCYKGFTNSSDLKKHEKVHSIKKEYRCQLCGNLEFTQKIHGKRHAIKYHPGIPVEECIVKQECLIP